MSRLSTTGLGLSVLALTAVCTAHGAGETSWTTGQARAAVRREAVVRIPQEPVATLVTELEDLIPRYRTYEANAADQESGVGGGPLQYKIHNIRYQLSTALRLIRSGLGVASAGCEGGGSSEAKRFRRFRCAVTSVALNVPTPAIVWDGDRIARVTEGTPRRVGPFRALLDVRVMGRTAFTYRQVVVAPAFREPVLGG